MEYLQIIRLWVRLERRTAAVRRVHDSTATTVSVTCSGGDTLALTWRSDDPLVVGVHVLAGLGCTSGVVSRDALRAVARAGLGRRCRLVVGGHTLRPSRARVRRLLDATDGVVPAREEDRVVDVAADAFLHAVLGPVAPHG